MKKKRLYWILFLSLVWSVLFYAGETFGQTSSIQASKHQVQYGIASYYADKFEGRRTSNGDIFRQKLLTAAHNSLPLGTYIRVINLRNRKSVVVKVNDRLHHQNTRLVDLSRSAATELGFIRSGTTRVRIEVLEKAPPAVKKS